MSVKILTDQGGRNRLNIHASLRTRVAFLCVDYLQWRAGDNSKRTKFAIYALLNYSTRCLAFSCQDEYECVQFCGVGSERSEGLASWFGNPFWGNKRKCDVEVSFLSREILLVQIYDKI